MVGDYGFQRQTHGTTMLPFESIQCPYCGEPSVDPQQYVEDCQVCCRPINVSVTTGDDGEVTVVARAENDV